MGLLQAFITRAEAQGAPLFQVKLRQTSQSTPQLEVVAEGVAISIALAVAGCTLGLSTLTASTL